MTASKIVAAAASGSAGGAGLDVDEVFSTYLHDGNSAVQKIENGIQLGAASTDNVALHMTGATSTDNGPLGLTVNSVGNATTSTTQTKFTSKSLYVDGTGSGDSTTCFDVQEGQIKLAKKDFTIEYWVYYNSHNSYGDLASWNYYVNGYDGNFRMGIGGSGTNINIFAYDSQTFLGSVSGTVSVSTGTWYHVAISRSNGTAYLFLDGTLVTSGAFDHDLTDAEIGGITLGKISAYEQVDAYFSDFRITVGAARYTSSFTAPSAALPVDSGTSGEGGLVWIKRRDGSNSHNLEDTARGTGKSINSDTTSAEDDQSGSYGISAFNSNGFSLVGAGGRTNTNNADYASWTWRKAPKFFDVLTYTGTGSHPRNVSHNLGSAPGMILVKNLVDNTDDWIVYHRGVDSSAPEDYGIFLNLTDSRVNNDAYWGDTAPTSTTFTVGGNITNRSGENYIAYLFAHNDGDGEFGPDSDQDIIKCGSYGGAAQPNAINLGFEPQWLLIKNSTTSVGDWYIYDNMRGVPTGSGDREIEANDSAAEAASSGGGQNWVDFNATGFTLKDGYEGVNQVGKTYIYMAIRRGPLAAPEDATKVFHIQSQSNGSAYSVGFPADLLLHSKIAGSSINAIVATRLTGNDKYLITSSTGAEGTSSGVWDFDLQNSFKQGATTGQASIGWHWKRAPSYFDVVAYTGTGSARTVSHNLGAVPEMIWVKCRSASSTPWIVYHKDLDASNPSHKYLYLNSTAAVDSFDNYWNQTEPTASVFSTKDDYQNHNNNASHSYIAYLFASLDGISKVGSYTGNSSDGKQIDCGFSNGARFVLLKNTTVSNTNWLLFDTVRGIVAGNDARLYLNTTDGEHSGTDYIDPYSSGFELTANAQVNYSGSTYIFYAIA